MLGAVTLEAIRRVEELQVREASWEEKDVCMGLPWALANGRLPGVWERHVQNLSHIGTDLR